MSGLAPQADSSGSATGRLQKLLGSVLHSSILLPPLHFGVLVGILQAAPADTSAVVMFCLPQSIATLASSA